MAKSSISLTKEEKTLIKGSAEAVDEYRRSAEFTQIQKNFDYYAGGSKMERSLRGGHLRFDKAGITDEKDARKSPRGDNSLYRAPAQKDDEPWAEFTRRRLVTVNYTRLIMKERGSILYKTPPTRQFEGGGAFEDEILDTYQNPDNALKGKFLAFHRNALLGGSVAVIPYPMGDEGAIVLKGIPRNRFHAIYDDEDAIISFTIFGRRFIKEAGRYDDFYQVWTPSGCYDLDKNKRVIEKTEHYCGEVPVCILRESSDDLSEPHLGDVIATDLVNNNEDINIKLSDLSRVSETQAHSILLTVNIGQEVRSGPGGRIDAQNVTEDRPVRAEYLHPDAKLSELQKILTSAIETLFMTGRVPKAVIMPDDNTTSGIHLKIQWFPVQRLFEEEKVIYVDNERRLAKKIALSKARWNAEQERAEVPDVELQVDFNEQNVIPKDDENKIQQDEWDLDYGLKSPVHILMERNPDLSEDEAVEKYKEIQALNKKIGFTPGKNGQKTSGTSKEILDNIEKDLLSEE